MANSMTGYARTRAEGKDLSIVVALKAVNHRFADIQIRMPPELDPFEPRLRGLIKKYVQRGQVQLGINLDWNAPVQEAKVNRSLLAGYLSAFRDIRSEYKLTGEPDLNVLLRVPGAVTLTLADLDEERRGLLEATLFDTLKRALETLNHSRQLEGASIIEDLRQRVEAMGRDLADLQIVREGTVQDFQKHLEVKLTELMERIQPDPQRILQEASILADRSDINEELQRLRTHLQRLVELLEADGEIGKKIDFIAQELNRETNTILSKSAPLGQAAMAVSEIGIRLKAEIEKIREQAQNLE
ncbi:MAG: YicC family protein [Acidobacteria bacterium]|nr:YicC family protein [Acidobacteriota bacterium]